LRDIHIVRGRRTWHSGTKHGGKAKSGYHGGSKDLHGNSPFWQPTSSALHHIGLTAIGKIPGRHGLVTTVDRSA
jgi:hypothetical protein